MRTPEPERCDKTELIKTECAHCRPVSNIDPPRTRDGELTAKFLSQCHLCPQAIIPGDRITRHDGRYVHAGCADDQE